jgi:hypothetical protein
MRIGKLNLRRTGNARLREWSSVEELARAMPEFAASFNENYLHSAPGYKTPNAFEKQWLAEKQKTLSAGTWLTRRSTNV